MSSRAHRLRRRAWRAQLAQESELRRRGARTNRKIAVERERGRRGDRDGMPAAIALAELAETSLDDVVFGDNDAALLQRNRLREIRERRAQVTVLSGDRLVERALLLAVLEPDELTTERVAAIVSTSDTVFEVSSGEFPIAWVYDGDSIETYRRVVALRGESERRANEQPHGTTGGAS